MSNFAAKAFTLFAGLLKNLTGLVLDFLYLSISSLRGLVVITVSANEPFDSTDAAWVGGLLAVSLDCSNTKAGFDDSSEFRVPLELCRLADNLFCGVEITSGIAGGDAGVEGKGAPSEDLFELDGSSANARASAAREAMSSSLDTEDKGSLFPALVTTLLGAILPREST